MLDIEKQLIAIAEEAECTPGGENGETEEETTERDRLRIAQLQERKDALQREFDGIDAQFKLVKRRIAELEADR